MRELREAHGGGAGRGDHALGVLASREIAGENQVMPRKALVSISTAVACGVGQGPLGQPVQMIVQRTVGVDTFGDAWELEAIQGRTPRWVPLPGLPEDPRWAKPDESELGRGNGLRIAE